MIIILASDVFFQKTGRNGLYNIQAIDNIPSIMRYGLLSNEQAAMIPHVSIAMNEVQDRRDLVRVPNGLALHQYSNLYFDYRNPMLSRKREQNDSICILKFDKCVLDLDGVVVSDRNAASRFVAFYSPEDGMDYIRFDLVYAKYWVDNNSNLDYYQMRERKAIKCAEVLVPHVIPFDYVVSAAVIGQNSKAHLVEKGFNKEIIVSKDCFF